MEEFFQHLSPESLHQRFFRAGVPRPELLRPLCDSVDPAQALTLVATRIVADRPQFIGVGTCIRIADATAEIAFAVSDAYRGKGIATVLLERLLVAGARNGFRRFRATTLPDNLAMQDVFRQSGFQVRAAAADGLVDIDLMVAPSDAGVAAAEARERTATVASIRPFFEPRGIAVIGASRNPGSIGRRVLDALLAAHSAAPVFPVHRSAGEIAGVQAFPRVSSIGRPVDLAVIAVPRDAVLGAVDDCAAAGVRAVIVITAGYAEVDDEGRVLQRRLVDRIRGCGMRMVGPNCMGLVTTDPKYSLNASFAPFFPPAGGLALSSQSGALGIVILALAAERYIGMSSFVSVGNKADVSGNDLIQYWEADPATRVIGLYLESFGNPRRFARIARRVCRAKPIVVVKAGRTAAGLRAASSHTAALASRDTAVDALLRQSGAIRTDTIDELFDVAACLATQPLPKGRRVAIVTNAGGPGILAADACDIAGLEIPAPSAALRERLRAALPNVPHPGNPVDMIASAGPEAYEAVITAILSSGDADALLVLYTPVDVTSAPHIHAAIARGVVAARAAGAHDTTVMACLMAERGFRLAAGSEQIPVYAFPENAARALGKVSAYAEWRQQPAPHAWSFDDLNPDRARAICRDAIAERGAGWLTPQETSDVLASFGLHQAAGRVSATASEALAAARAIGYPVVAKLVSPNLTHKTELGGVRTALADDAALARAFRELFDTADRHGLPFGGVLVQAMARGVAETMVGVIRDESFGALVGFGLGGTEVELLGDMQFGLAPLTDRDVDDLIARSRARVLLAGHRGRPPGDRDALVDVLLRVSSLADSVPEVAELDLNPVMVMPAGDGVQLVDVRVRVSAPTTSRI
jgi:acyl-CoA synthetase (NDP forming)/GNAT superfamily N-acetyltransferase